jgi:release factor glutamine methyltransferase
MMMHALGWEKEKLVKLWTDKLNNDQYNRYQKLLQRRLNREPLAYIVGYKYFYELKFFVDDRVLIPRPETEIMVEKALSILRKMGTETDQFSLVDVGTGCGNIALSIANRVNFIKIFAVDDAFDAIEVAKINAVLLGLEQNVGFIRGDMLSALPHPVNLILANLPYIPETQYAQLEPEIVKYEPKSALTAGPDGLDAYRRLFAQAPQYLLRGGKIICELDPPQIPELKTIILRNIPSATIEVTPDLQGNERLVTVHTS